MTDEEAVAIVQKALESGSLKQRNAVTVVTGIMGSGKTWLLSRLFRIKPPDLYTSTGVAEKSFRGLMRRIAHIRSFDLLTLDQIFEFLAPLFLAGIPAADVVSLAQSFATSMASQYPSEASLTSSSISRPTTTSPPSSSPSLLDVSSVDTSPSEKTHSSKAMANLVQTAKTSKESFMLELLHMIDTGGQPEFMEVMPCLIHHSDLTILVLDLTKSLDAYPALLFYENGTAFNKPIVSPRTNRQILKQIVRTMQAKRGKKKRVHSSKILVIGTHKDCIKEDKLSEVLHNLNKELAAIFLPTMEEELILYRKGEIVHALNLLSPDSDDEKVLDCIRKNISKAGIGVEMNTPLCLFMFEQDAIKYAEEQREKGRHVMVLSLDECLLVGARLKMSSEVVQAALIYFHCHNVFLYFRHILPNLVFLNPQVPLDFVNAIVRFSYMAKTDTSLSLTAQQVRFCDEGILTEELLQHEYLSTSFVPNLYEPRHALNLFQHIFTIAPLSEDSTLAESSEPYTIDSQNPAQTTCIKPSQKSLAQISLSESAQKLLATPAQKLPDARKTEYLMMCLLPDKSQIEIDHCLPSTSHVFPLLLQFSNDCAPSGSFGNTISCLISSFKWKIAHTRQGKLECLAHNIVTLRPHNAPVKVTLVNSTCYFEIHINVKDSSLEKYCPEINSTIFAAVRKVFQTMQFDDIEVEPAFLCPCDPTCAHAATIFPKSDVTIKSMLECSETEDIVGKLEWNQRVWFQDWHLEKQEKVLQQSPQPNERLPATDCQPTLPQLIDFKTSTGSMNITECIGTSYSKLGPLLLRDNDGAVTQAIREQYHLDAAKINQEILQRWLQGKGRQPVQWFTLIDVLKKIQLSPLAKEIEDNLQ